MNQVKLRVLQDYLEDENLVVEAGAIEDLFHAAKVKTKKKIKKLWKDNRSRVAYAAFLISIGVLARDSFESDGAIQQGFELVDYIFGELEPGDYTVHIVENGESFWSIAEQYYPSVAPEKTIPIILEENGLTKDSILQIGQQLRLPRMDAIIKSGEEVTSELAQDSEEEGRAIQHRIASDQLIKLIKMAEGSSVSKGAVPHNGRIHSTGYRNGTDHTIGFGHALTLSEKRAAGLATGGKDRDGNPIWATVHGVNITYHPDWKGISDSEAEKILRGDLNRFESMVNKKNFDISQHEFDSLIHFSYNIGNVPDSITRMIRAKDYDSVPGKMKEYIFAGGKKSDGLINRREKESAIWSSGIY